MMYWHFYDWPGFNFISMVLTLTSQSLHWWLGCPNISESTATIYDWFFYCCWVKAGMVSPCISCFCTICYPFVWPYIFSFIPRNYASPFCHPLAFGCCIPHVCGATSRMTKQAGSAVIVCAGSQMARAECTHYPANKSPTQSYLCF